IVDVSVLERHSIDDALNAFKDFIPFALVFGQGYSVFPGDLTRSREHGFFSVYPGRDQRRQCRIFFFALTAQRGERLYRPLCASADLHAEIPTLEALVMSVPLPYLVNDKAVGVNLVTHVAGIPINTAV